MRANNPETDSSRSVIEKVNKLLEEHFTQHPPSRPKLDTFHAPEAGVLGSLWRKDVKVPLHPQEIKDSSTTGWAGSRLPSLLLYDLQNEEHKQTKSNAYLHIESQQEIGPTCLYGTSGAGKTRRLLEYLSHNKGFYLLAGDFARNPGSKDLLEIFQGVGKRAIPRTDEGRAISSENLDTIAYRFRILLFIRHTLHGLLEKKLGALSPWEWLVYQLFPEIFLKGDIFLNVLRECCIDDLDTHKMSLVARKEINYEWSICVDESQRLLNAFDGYFLSKDGNEMRSNFSALLKASCSDAEIFNNKVKFPVFSGTGYSLDAPKKEGGSASAKVVAGVLQQHVQVFREFLQLDAGKVEDYINKFLDSTKVHHDVKQHISRWLRGRPRWTATFLETYALRKRKSGTKGLTRVRGDFSEEDRKVLEALDRFLAVMTCDTETANRRASWNAGEASAYSSIAHLMTLEKNEVRAAQRDLETAVFRFAVGHRPHQIKEDPSKRLIEAGVAAVKVEEGDGMYVTAFLDEPILVQAGINYFCLDSYLTENLIGQEAQGQGQAFERVLLPVLLQDHNTSLQSNFQQQLSGCNAEQLTQFRVSKKSSYGVLTLDVGAASTGSTIEWIKAAINGTIEGQVPPFCYPDNYIGPDVIFLMWNEAYTDFRTCLVQSKYEVYTKQLDALRTLVVDWLYYKNRNKPSKRAFSLAGDLASEWNKVKDSLVSDKRPCLRLLVQWPAKLTTAAVAGRVAPDGTGPNDRSAKKAKRDWLVTISNSNLHLFGEDAQSVIRLIKKAKKE